MHRLLHRTGFHLLLVCLLGLLVYSNTFSVPFVFDDEQYVVNNPAIRDFGFFLEPSRVSSGDLPENVRMHFGTRYLGFISFALSYRLHGFEVAGYHAFNLLVHVLNACLVYFLITLLFGTASTDGPALKEQSGHIGLFSALLFVAHPVQTQAVTYISQRFTSLAAFFYLLSVLLYIRCRAGGMSRKSGYLYVLSLLSAVAAMKTKEISFTLPLAILLYELLFSTDAYRKRALHALPFMASMLVIPLGVLDWDRPLPEAIAGATTTEQAMPRWPYILTQPRVIVTYLRLLLFPVNQNADYDNVLFGSLFHPEVFLPLLFLLSLLAALWYTYRRSKKRGMGLRPIAFGGFWFFLTLSVESAIVLADVTFEHRIYLPSAGAFMAIACGAVLSLRKLGSEKMRKAALMFLLMLPVLLSSATYARNTVWKSSTSLWEDVVSKSRYNPRGHYNLAMDYLERGIADKAIEHFRASLELKPDMAKTHYGLATAYMSRGLPHEAIEHYEAALKLRPDNAPTHYNMGLALRFAGQTERAIEHLQASLYLDPDNADAHYNLGLVFLEKKLMDRARGEF
jgi:cytochrome c-type biogenesis protein CcmH/NrfG